MVYKFLLLFMFISASSIYSKDLTDPFAPVNETRLSSQHIFTDQPIESLKLFKLVDMGKGFAAVIIDPFRNRYTVSIGDIIGDQSGKVILIEKNRVVVMIKTLLSGKTVLKIGVLKK